MTIIASRLPPIDDAIKEESDSRTGPRFALENESNWERQRTMEARQAYRRLELCAKDDKWKENKSNLWVGVNQWVYEARYGKPKVSVDNRLTIDVVPAMETLQMVEQLKALTNKGNQILLNQFNQETIEAEFTEVPNGTE